MYIKICPIVRILSKWFMETTGRSNALVTLPNTGKINVTYVQRRVA